MSLVDQLSAHIAKAIDDRSLELPMLPEVASQVLVLVNSAESDAAELARVIQTDQALAGNVMRIANSAAYSPNVKLVSLQQAIARLGMRAMGEIAVSASLGPKLFTGHLWRDVIEEHWRFALACANWSREVARQARQNVELAFLCGLLHEMGKPVVLQAICNAPETIAVANLRDEELRELMQRHHRQCGALLAGEWQLPDAVQTCIAHAGPDAGDNDSTPDITSIVNTAQQFADSENPGAPEFIQAICSQPCAVKLNLYQDDLEALAAKADAVNTSIRAMIL